MMGGGYGTSRQVLAARKSGAPSSQPAPLPLIHQCGNRNEGWHGDAAAHEGGAPGVQKTASAALTGKPKRFRRQAKAPRKQLEKQMEKKGRVQRAPPDSGATEAQQRPAC